MQWCVGGAVMSEHSANPDEPQGTNKPSQHQGPRPSAAFSGIIGVLWTFRAPRQGTCNEPQGTPGPSWAGRTDITWWLGLHPPHRLPTALVTSTTLYGRSSSQLGPLPEGHCVSVAYTCSQRHTSDGGCGYILPTASLLPRPQGPVTLVARNLQGKHASPGQGGPEHV